MGYQWPQGKSKVEPKGGGGSALAAEEIAALKKVLEALEEKIMGIIDGVHVQFDPTQALLLTHAFGFEQGFLVVPSQHLHIPLNSS